MRLYRARRPPQVGAGEKLIAAFCKTLADANLRAAEARKASKSHAPRKRYNASSEAESFWLGSD